jgi:hypothetical protein
MATEHGVHPAGPVVSQSPSCLLATITDVSAVTLSYVHLSVSASYRLFGSQLCHCVPEPVAVIEVLHVVSVRAQTIARSLTINAVHSRHRAYCRSRYVMNFHAHNTSQNLKRMKFRICLELLCTKSYDSIIMSL